MATTTAAAAGAATAAPPLPLSTTTIRIDDASPSSSPSLGCPSLRGFFDAVDSGLRFLEREAADAEKTAALDEARAHVSLVGDGASKTTATTTQPTSTQTEQPKRCSRRAPAPGWAWVADHLLSLVQQYSSGLSEPVMRTSLWQAWRQLPPDGEPTPQLRWTALSTLLESAASDPVPRAATRGADTICVRLSGIGGKGGAAANSTSNSTTLLEVSDASTRGATCSALLHSSLESSVVKAEGRLARAVGGTLRMGGVVAWRPTGAKTMEEEEEAEEEAAAEDEEEGDENNGGGGERKKKKKNANDFVRPFLLPTPAILLVASDLPGASILAGRGDGAPAALLPISAVATSSSSTSNSSSSVAVAAGVVVSVGALERDFGTAAAARAASGVARVVWLSDNYEKRGEGAAETGGGPNPPSSAAPTPLLLLDALAAAGDALFPGEVLLLPGATRVPPPPGVPPANAPCALEARPGALLVVVPCSTSSSSPPNDDDDDGEGLTATAATAAAAHSGESSKRPQFASLRPGVTRVALAGTLVSSSLMNSLRKARQQQTRVGSAAANSIGGGNSKERDLVLTLDDGSGVLVELHLPSVTAPRSAWAARPGEVVVATAARASVERKEENEGTKKVSSFVVVPAGRCALQSLPRLPALLASPSLAVPGLSSLESALEQLVLPSSKLKKEEGKKAPCCALTDAVVAAAPAVAVRRAHSICGRPLRRSALDPSAMAEMMMMMVDEDGGGGGMDFDDFSSEGKSGVGGRQEEPAAAIAPAPPAPTAQGSLVLSVPAPTPGPSKGGSTGKKKRPATPAGAAAAADDAGFLWTCDFCGEDCSASGVTLTLELDLKLTGKEEGEGAPKTVIARAEGAAAASLLGCVPSEFVAWAPKARAAKAAALEGRRVRVALVPSSSSVTGSGDAVVDIVGVMVLDDEDREEEDGSGSDGEVM